MLYFKPSHYVFIDEDGTYSYSYRAAQYKKHVSQDEAFVWLPVKAKSLKEAEMKAWTTWLLDTLTRVH